MKEVWKDIPGYEKFYQASNTGKVRSIDRIINNRKYVGVVLKPVVNEWGYKIIVLTKLGKKKNTRVHRVIAKTFIKNTNNKPCVNHKDGDKTNNHVDNLEWCTHKENSKHAVKTNLILTGEDSKSSKLTKKQVLEIRRLYKNGEMSVVEISKKYNVFHNTISSIVNRRTWKNL